MKKKSLLLLALVTGSIFIQFLLPSSIAVAQTAPPSSTTPPPEEPKTCENGQSLGWFLCPVLSLVDEGVRDLDEAINAVLVIRQDVYNTPQLHEVWARLRNLAYIILVPIILVMVIGTAIGSDLISAYSVKKAMPRFGVAVIFITLSWPILQFLIGFTNIVGMGIGGLISGPFGGFENIKLGSLFTGSAKGLFTSLVAGVGVAGAVAATASLGVVLSFALAAAVGLFFGYVLLAGRQFLVIALMLLAPLAILAWIFPGNDKLWKAWWGSFSKLLMLYPLIMILIAGGRVFAQVVFKASGPDVAGPDAMASTVLKLAAYIGPFFLIPSVFKFAGGVFATVSGMTNDKTKGLFDRNKKWRGQQMAKNFADTRGGNRFKTAPAGGIRSRLNTVGAYATNINKAGLRPSNMKANMSTALGAMSQQEIEKNMKENMDYQPWMHNDGLNKAASESRNSAELRDALVKMNQASIDANNGPLYSSPQALDEDVARVERVRRSMGNNAFKQMTTLQALAGGTAYETADEAWGAVAAAAGNDDAAASYLIAKGRSALMSAGRVDQGGAGFGDTLKAVSAMRKDLREHGTITDATKAEVNSVIHKGAIESQGAGVLAHASMKDKSIKQLVPEFRKKLADAAAGNNPEEYERQLAFFANVYDSMAATSPKNASVLADQVMRWDPTTGVEARATPPGVATSTNTIQRAIADRRGNAVFQSTRRELNQREAETGVVGGGGGLPGPGGPPTTASTGL